MLDAMGQWSRLPASVPCDHAEGCGAAQGEACRERPPGRLVARERLQHEQREGDKWWWRARTWKALAKRLRGERYNAERECDEARAVALHARAELERVRAHVGRDCTVCGKPRALHVVGSWCDPAWGGDDTGGGS
jgi:hypothetical protein